MKTLYFGGPILTMSDPLYVQAVLVEGGNILAAGSLDRLEAMDADGRMALLPKKEQILLHKELAKLQTNLNGIRNMKKVPDAIFVIDTNREGIALHEAHRLEIPVVGTLDTNCDPDEIDYVIPGNDDAIRAVKLIAGKLADAVLEGRQGEQDAQGEAAPEEEAAKVEA